jgi:hypothetical protein
MVAQNRRRIVAAALESLAAHFAASQAARLLSVNPDATRYAQRFGLPAIVRGLGALLCVGIESAIPAPFVEGFH